MTTILLFSLIALPAQTPPTEAGGDPGLTESLPLTKADLDKVNAQLARGVSGPKGNMANAKQVAMGMLTIVRQKYLNPPIHRGNATGQRQINQFVHLMLPQYDYRIKFCALGVAHTACLSYAKVAGISPTDQAKLEVLRKKSANVNHDYFPLSPVCEVVRQKAKLQKTNGKPMWVGYSDPAANSPQPGWLVLFNWSNRTGKADHIGIVDVQKPSVAGIETLEFNTVNPSLIATGGQSNGGAVSEKHRATANIIGYVRTY